MPADEPVIVKSTPRPVHSGAVLVKSASGVSYTLMLCIRELLQYASLMVRLMSFVPAVLYVMPVGFSAEDVCGFDAAPKSHAYVQSEPVLPVLVKSKVASRQSSPELVKFTVG